VANAGLPQKDEDEWHDKKCLNGQCNDCGIKKNPLCPIKCNGYNLVVVEWKIFAMEIIVSRLGIL
jgi:hypothetical protein